ncbi:MAG: sugar ABC transporter permease [Lachnospiraceae bacterium]|nr:sugar ABC transporter permease [Lachnospiraceae bacterium]MBQ7777158.1 sugar ABC transporter permease [Lachnospiraceae bacterium]
MSSTKTEREQIAGKIYYLNRIAIIFSIVMMFFPAINPAKVCGYVNKNMSLLTTGTSYSKLIEDCTRAFRQGWVNESSFQLLFYASMITCIGIVIAAVCGCMSLGNVKMQKTGNWFAIGGSILQIIGLMMIHNAYTQVAATSRPEKVEPELKVVGFALFMISAIIVLVTTVIIQLLLPKVEKGTQFEMLSKYKLFLMFLPFIALTFVFSYLPLWGWRYAFFDYKSGGTLSADNFVGFKWFTQLFQNEATRQDIVRVLRNTLAMSGIGILTSWLPMAFAIFLSEIKSARVKRFVQTFATIPNFISWVLVYAIAFAIFATDGFLSSILQNMGVLDSGFNYLMPTDHMWLKMWAWGTWKGLGWSAIIYISGIAGIDQQLYEAATVDGAGRFQKMWHITVPGLIPTFMVLLLMSVAGVLSNGMDQYLVFETKNNIEWLNVLDLYVYKLGINNGAIPLSTVVGMTKSIISVVLLFLANGISKLVRGESIV